MNNLYGENTTEENVKDMIKAREIVSEILNFGVNEKQKLKICYLLSLELENRENMLEIVEVLKPLLDKSAKKIIS